jgi:hypothetical protein
MSQNSRNYGFSYYICLMTEGSGSRARSGSGKSNNTWIRWIRIRNTAPNNFFQTSVMDPDPILIFLDLQDRDPYASLFVRFPDPSTYHQAKIVRKTLISSVL